MSAAQVRSAAVCAIHQPNFFPWLGYFDKIRRADVFVFLDQVAYPRAGSGGMGSWTNRVRIRVQGEARWVGCPLRRQPLGTPINETIIDDGQPWRDKLLRTLAANYRKAVHYERTMAALEPVLRQPGSNLADFNIHAIESIAARLGLTCRFVRQSDLASPGQATEMLIALTKAAGAGVYLCGGGAGGYQEDHLFLAHDVELRYQNFRPEPYGPADAYIPGLSVIDYLMHDGRPLAEAFPDAEA
jgi:hypothetical protein